MRGGKVHVNATYSFTLDQSARRVCAIDGRGEGVLVCHGRGALRANEFLHCKGGDCSYCHLKRDHISDKRSCSFPGHPGLDPGSRFFIILPMGHRGGWVYVMADRYRGTMYVGVTSDVPARVYQHRTGDGSDFCRRYGLHRLVWAEHTPTITEAIAHEKRIKRWRRDWKFALLEKGNPEWRDLFDTLV